jgi:hypothetical protein
MVKDANKDKHLLLQVHEQPSPRGKTPAQSKSYSHRNSLFIVDVINFQEFLFQATMSATPSISKKLILGPFSTDILQPHRYNSLTWSISD